MQRVTINGVEYLVSPEQVQRAFDLLWVRARQDRFLAEKDLMASLNPAPPRTPRGKPRSEERLKAEKAVKRMIAQGKPGKEICDKLGVSRSIYQRIRKEVEG